MPSPNGETEIAVTQEKGEKAVEDWTVIGRRSCTGGWVEDTHRMVGQSWAQRWMSADVRTQPVSMFSSRCWGNGLSVEEPIRSDCKGVHRSGVSTRMTALLVVLRDGLDSVKIAYMSGRVLPSHEVQYVEVKAGEAGRSSSGNRISPAGTTGAISLSES